MNRIIAIVSVAFLLCGFSASTSEHADKYIAKSVRIYIADETLCYAVGTGFFIEGGRVITNEHVATGRKGKIYVEDGAGEFVTAEIIAVDKTSDLAILQTDATDHPYFTMAQSFDVGDDIVSIGSFTETELRFHVREAVTVDVRDIRLRSASGEISEPHPRLAYDIAGYPGLSGSPVINKDGEIVGVHVGSNREYPISYAVTLEDLLEFLLSNAVTTIN